MTNILYLASGSRSRKRLLQESGIPFAIIDQTADEHSIDRSLPFDELLIKIALLKMEHAVLPKKMNAEEIFVLTADTMGYVTNGAIHGKPKDYEDAVKKIRNLSGKPTTTKTAFCLEKKIWQNNNWQTETQHTEIVSATYLFNVKDELIDTYIKHSFALQASGAISIESYGEQFLAWVHGSYSTILGLPMFEVRNALEKMNFFKSYSTIPLT